MKKDILESEKEFHDIFYDEQADHIYEGYAYSLVKKRNINFIINEIQDSKNKRMLSLGCGNGSFELLLSKHFSEITAVDLSPKAIEIAQQRAKEMKIDNVIFKVGDANIIDFPDNSFDAVLALSVLHHIPDDAIDKLLSEAHRVLKPGGKFISLDPNLFRLAGIFKVFVAKTFKRYHSPDERELSPMKLSAAFQKSQYRDVQIHWMDYFYNPFCWVFPKTAKPVAASLSAFDEILIKIPFLNRTSNSFSIVARK